MVPMVMPPRLCPSDGNLWLLASLTLFALPKPPFPAPVSSRKVCFLVKFALPLPNFRPGDHVAVKHLFDVLLGLFLIARGHTILI